MTEQEATAAVDAAARGVRRIFLVALAAAVVAAGVTFGLELSLHSAAAPVAATPPLPLTFEQPGFVDHAVQRHQTDGFDAHDRHGVMLVAGASGASYVVVRCDTGRVTIATPVLTSAQACTGRPVGVIALASVRQGTRLDVTVSRPQHAGWAVGIYR